MDREYGLGRRRTDLLIVLPYAGGVQRAVIELKLLHGGLEATIAAGLEQTWAYADAVRRRRGAPVIFDRTPGKAWGEKIWERVESYRGLTIAVWGCQHFVMSFSVYAAT